MKFEINIESLLDEVMEHLTELRINPETSVANFSEKLNKVRFNQTSSEWKKTINQCRSHPLCNILHQDPLTERSFRKPRGYQGDADLLDIIYNKNWEGIYDKDVTLIGKSIFNYTISCQAPAAVRERSLFLSSKINEICCRVKNPKILSVACGHLREVLNSKAFVSGRVGRFVGLDQDPKCIKLVNDELGQYGVEGVIGSIKNLYSGILKNEKFDFIYSAGLFDYLDDTIARRLTSRMFNMLQPQGCLLIANYLHNLQDAGYMEAYMDWKLIYRDIEQLKSFVSEIPSAKSFQQTQFLDNNKAIGYTQISRL